MPASQLLIDAFPANPVVLSIAPVSISIWPHRHATFTRSPGPKISMILKWVEDGCVLAIFPYNFPDFRYRDGKPVAQSFNKLPPFDMITLSPIEGELLSTLEPFKAEFTKFENLFIYSFTMAGSEIRPIYGTQVIGQGELSRSELCVAWVKGRLFFHLVQKIGLNPTYWNILKH